MAEPNSNLVDVENHGPANEASPENTAAAGTSDMKKGNGVVSSEANLVEDDRGTDVLSLHSINTTLPRRTRPPSNPESPPQTPLLVFFKLTGDVLLSATLLFFYVLVKVWRVARYSSRGLDWFDLVCGVGIFVQLAAMQHVKSLEVPWLKWFFDIDYAPDIIFGAIMFFIIGSGGIVQLMSHRIDVYLYIAKKISAITHSTSLGPTLATWVVSSFGLLSMVALFVIMIVPLGYIRRKRAPLIWSATYLDNYTGLGEPSYDKTLWAIYVGSAIIGGILEFGSGSFELWIRKHIRGL